MNLIFSDWLLTAPGSGLLYSKLGPLVAAASQPLPRNHETVVLRAHWQGTQPRVEQTRVDHRGRGFLIFCQQLMARTRVADVLRMPSWGHAPPLEIREVSSFLVSC